MEDFDIKKLTAVEIKAVKCDDGKWRGYLFAPDPKSPTAEDWGVQQDGPGYDSFKGFIESLTLHAIGR